VSFDDTAGVKRMTTRHALVAALVAGAVGVATAGATATGEERHPARIPQATPAQLRAAGLGKLKLTPPARRVDLDVPGFSRPTRITNPLFPISRLRSAVLSGRVEGKPFKTETTLLPFTRIIEWPAGRPVETAVSQYVAYLDGRLEEVALDHYAQADDGSVWYFGEDVFNYAEGAVADLEGTWLAGREGPAAMIMPARPRVGDAYRSENVPGLVFEEVTISAVGRTVAGPKGPIARAIVGRELHQDGTTEDKTFAPGYGEFFTGGGGDVEAMSLAVPTDALPGPMPPSLAAILDAAGSAFGAARASRWSRASAAVARVGSASAALRREILPPRLATRLARAVAAASAAVNGRRPVAAARAAAALGDAALDVSLRYRAPARVDRARFAWWARRLALDAGARDEAGVRGDLAGMEWIRDRFAHTLGPVERIRLDATLVRLRVQVGDGELGEATRSAARLAALAGR
jgi:hypothetical protein